MRIRNLTARRRKALSENSLDFLKIVEDKWKAKYQAAKYKIKLLTSEIRYLEKRKAELKNRVKDLEKELNPVTSG
jgi:cell division protein FtsB